jgi:hypothetical protein
VRDGVPQSPHIKELIKMAQAVQDEFDTRVMKRSSWKEHEGEGSFLTTYFRLLV